MHAFVNVVLARGFVASIMVVGVNCVSLKLRRLGNSWNDADRGLGLFVFEILGALNLHLHRLRAFRTILMHI